MTNKHIPLSTQNPPRRKIQLTCPEISITDPDETRSFTMASIKKNLEKGIMPHLTNDAFYSLQPLKYSNLQDSLNFHQEVTNNFNSLPSGLRKLMGNDLRNFETFVLDPKNADVLKQYGLASQPDATNQNIVENLQDLKNAMIKSQEQDDPNPPTKARK